jgi:hypothetical protein
MRGRAGREEGLWSDVGLWVLVVIAVVATTVGAVELLVTPLAPWPLVAVALGALLATIALACD